MTEGVGATAEDSVGDLAQLIVNEANILIPDKGKVEGYAAHVKEMLKKFIVTGKPTK